MSIFSTPGAANNNRNKVINIDTGEVFNSQLEAAEYYGLSQPWLSRCIKEKKSYGELRFKKLGDYESTIETDDEDL